MIRRICLSFFLTLLSVLAVAQELKTRNIIVVTLDGLRWDEVFKGADERILRKSKYNADTAISVRFGDAPAEKRRELLLPFFWTTIATEGQLYGNRDLNNKVNCANWHLLSYPGYAEMLVGFVDHRVSSNDHKPNPHSTVLEFLNEREQFRGRVAAFATWDVFPYILREKQSGIPVNAGVDKATGELTLPEKWMNQHPDLITNEGGGRYDEFTFRYALEYLKRERPRVLFIGLDETDTHAHGGKYDEYLKAAHRADALLAELWAWVQSHPDYKDQTTLLITTDHGRGNGPNSWKNHRLLAPGSRHIWLAVMGPDTPAFGEISFKGKHYQKQTAKSIAAFLGVEYRNKRPVGDIITTMLSAPIPRIFDKPDRSDATARRSSSK